MQLSDVRPHICPSVASGRRTPLLRVCCLLWVRRLGDTDRLLHGRRAGGQQQPRRSTARSSKCGECHVVLS